VAVVVFGVHANACNGTLERFRVVLDDGDVCIVSDEHAVELAGSCR
jgi:hypothetical protein